MQAAELFTVGCTSAQVAKELRVTRRSASRWRRAWETGGVETLVSTGPAARPRLSPEQFGRLEAALERGPLAPGLADQPWTLARIKALIGRRFHLGYTIPGVWYLLCRNGWSCPARRAIERDDGTFRWGKTRSGRSWKDRVGHRLHLLSRLHRYHRRVGEEASFTWRDYRGFLALAHHELRTPIGWSGTISTGTPAPR